MKLHRNFKIFINYFLGPVIFLWLSWSIYRQVQRQPNLEMAWEQILESFSSSKVWFLVAVAALMFVNWGIETVKWRMSIRSVQTISFFKAFRAVLSGVSFSVSTPNRIGEYFGRMLYMDEGNRLKTISITIVGSISQLIITLLMGLAGLIFMRAKIESAPLVSSIWMQVLIYGTSATLLVITLFYFRLSWLVKWLDRLPGSKRFSYLLSALESFDFSLLLRLLFLSALRFLVFILQYYFLFAMFDVEISWAQAFWSISVSFLVLAVIPTFAIAELGLRGEVSLKLIGLFSVNNIGILMVTIIIWLINLVLPAIAGSLFILGIRKIFKREKATPLSE
jgi:uncharacterized membrane protein YbhN (UPF0104 family)